MQPDNIGYRIAMLVYRASLCIFLEERCPLKGARVMPVQSPWGIFYRHMERRRQEGEGEGGGGGETGRPLEGTGRKEGNRGLVGKVPEAAARKLDRGTVGSSSLPFSPSLSFSLPKTIAPTSGTIAGFIPTFLPRYFI